MEEAWFVAIQDSLFAWWICKAEDTMTVFSGIFVSKPAHLVTRKEEAGKGGATTYSGSLLGAHTIATLSGNIT